MSQQQLSFSRRVLKVLPEIAIFFLVLVMANFVATLAFPDPFRVQTWHTYSGEEAQKLIDVNDRRGWVTGPIIIVYVGISIWKSRR